MSLVTAFEIKVIAIVTMLIDHIGLAFFLSSPYYLIFRLIGRISFPLFAWAIANGAHHTKNVKHYMARLFVFAFISQIPYLLFHQHRDSSFFQFNIFFTLFLGLIVIFLLNRIKNEYFRALLIVSAAFMAEVFHFEYGAAGLLTIVVFYLFFADLKKAFIYLIVIFSSIYLLPVILEYKIAGRVNVDAVILMQPLAVVSILFISRYNQKEGLKLKYIFYIFYPLHLFILYLIQTLL